MDTYFDPPEKTNEKELVAEIEIINNHPVMTGLLHSMSGLLAILDEHRQIVALNDSFLKMLGIDDSADALGLRTGVALECIHAHEEPAGCGTTKYCSTCGAAIAISVSLGQDKPVERICALTAKRNDILVDISLLIRATPIRIDEKRFLLLFIQDITLQQQRAALERTFFHDISNMLGGLLGASELLVLKNRDSELVKMLHSSALRLTQEINMQRCLVRDEHFSCQPLLHEVSPAEVMKELKSFFINHTASVNKNLDFSPSAASPTFRTDLSMLLRVLCNMVTNALEATAESGLVRVWTDQPPGLLSFCVWNDKTIPEDIARRVFQRNFSTKEGDGRGIGTYSMKLFGEKFLGGEVGFTTSRKEGTIFRISLPVE